MADPCLEELSAYLDVLLAQNPKITEQRNTCKNILNWLAEERQTSVLDEATGNSDITWKILLDDIISYVSNASKPQPFQLDLLRICLQRAGASKHGSSFPSLRNVSKHILDVLKNDVHPFKNEYADLLSKLLKMSSFRCYLSGPDQQGFVNYCLEHVQLSLQNHDIVDISSQGLKTDLFVHLDMLSCLFRELYRDDQLESKGVIEIFEFLELVGTRLQDFGDYGRLATPLFDCIAEFLLCFAVDYQERAAKLLQAVSDLIAMTWGQGLDQTKVKAMQGIRVFLCAHIDVEIALITDTLSRLRQEVSGLKFKETLVDKKFQLSKETFYLMDLLSDLVWLRLQRKSESQSQKEHFESQSAFKRTKPENASDWLLDCALPITEGKVRLSLPWVQFMGFFCSKYPAAVDIVFLNMGQGSDRMNRTTLARLATVIANPLDDLHSLWTARCLQSLYLGLAERASIYATASRSIFQNCLEVLKVRIKRTDGYLVTSAYFKLQTIMLLREAVAPDLIYENIETIWGFLLHLWKGDFFQSLQGRTSAAQSEHYACQDEVIEWMTQILQISPFTEIRGMHDEDHPRNAILHLILSRMRGDEQSDRIKRFARLIMCLICGSQGFECRSEKLRLLQQSSLHVESRAYLFGLQPEQDSDQYVWEMRGEDDDRRFERMLEGISLITRATTSSIDNKESSFEKQKLVPDSSQQKIIIPNAHTNRMRKTLNRFLQGQDSSASLTSDEGLRTFMIASLFGVSFEFLEPMPITEMLEPLIRKLLADGRGHSSQPDVLISLARCLSTLSNESKLRFLEKVEYLASTMVCFSTENSLDGSSTVALRSFLGEVCRQCARLWNVSSESHDKGRVDDFFCDVKEKKSSEIDAQLRLVPLRAFLNLFSSEYLIDNQAALIQEVKRLFEADSMDRIEGLCLNVMKLSVLSSPSIHSLLYELYLDVMNRIMPMKRSDEFNHQRKLVVLRAAWCIAHAIKCAGEECDMSDFKRKVMDKGGIVGKFLDAHRKLSDKRPMERLPRDIRRLLARTCGEVLIATKEADRTYVDYILTCLKDQSFEVRHEAVISCPAFFTTWDSPEAIFFQVLENLPTDKTTCQKTFLQTHIHALTKIGSLEEHYTSDAIEGHCVYLLCEFFHRFSSSKALRVQIEKSLACIGSKSNLKTKDLIRMHMHSILCKWIRTFRRWEEFPCELAGHSSIQDFCRDYVIEVLVPEFLLFDGKTIKGQKIDARQEIDLLCRTCGWDLIKVANKSYASFIAKTLQLCTSFDLEPNDASAPEQFRDINTLLEMNDLASAALQQQEQFYGKISLYDRVDEVLTKILDTLINGLQLAGCRNFEPDSSYLCSAEELELMVAFGCARLAEMLKSNCRCLLLGYSPARASGAGHPATKISRSDRFQRLLLYCLRHLKTSTRVQKRQRVLGAVRVLLSDDLIGNCLETPWLFYHVVYFLLQAANIEWALSTETVQILRSVVEKALQHNHHFLFEGGVLTRIVCSMVPLAQRAAAENQSPNVFTDFIELLLERTRRSNLMQTLPPFPNDSAFVKINKLCEGSASHHTLERFLQRFLVIEGHLPSILREAYLLQLVSFLKSGLFGKASLTDSIHKTSKAQHLTRKLLQMAQAQEIGDLKTRSLLGQCIAYCFTGLSRIDSMSESLWSLPILLPASRPSTKIRPSVEVFALTLIGEKMIRALKGYTETDDSVDVAETAADLLKDLLRFESPIRNELLSSKDLLDEVTKDYLVPYTSDKNAVLLKSFPADEIDQDSISFQLQDAEFWKIGDSYETWICKICRALCFVNPEHPVWPVCARLCLIKPAFAELVFPHLLLEAFMQSRLRSAKESSLWPIISNEIQQVLECAPVSSAQLAAVRIVLRALEFFNALRCDMVKHQGNPFADEVLSWPSCYCLDVPYVITASAALRCGAPLTSLLFLEMHASNASNQSIRDVSSLLEKRNPVQQALIDAYQDIDEPDGNIAFDKGLDLESVISAYDRDEEWGKALGMYDMTMMRNVEHPIDPNIVSGRFFNALNNCGMTYLASTIITRVEQPKISDLELRSEASWRSEHWGLTITGMTEDLDTECRSHFHVSLYQALSLCSCNSVSDLSLSRHINEARNSAMHDLEKCNLMQSTKRLLPSLIKLRMVEDVNAFVEILSQKREQGDQVLKNLLFSWEQWYRSMLHNDFKYWEPAMTLHSILLKFAGNHEVQKNHFCLMVKFAIKCNKMEYARTTIHKLQAFATQSSSDGSIKPSDWWLRLAKFYWKDGKEGKALSLLLALEQQLRTTCKRITAGASETASTSLLAQVLASRASWLASSRSSNWYEVQELFQESVQVQEDANRRFRFAAFMDSLYSAEQSQAEEVRKQQKDLERQRRELEEMKKIQSADVEIRKSCSQREKYLNFHEANVKERNQNKQRFLLSSLDNYLQCLDFSKKRGHGVFRVLHLWFENNDDQDVNSAVLKGLKRLQSCKEFLIVVPQIISRLDKKSTLYQEAIWFLVMKLLQQEPQELLFHIQAAKNEEFAKHQVKSTNVSVTVNANKVQASKEIISKFAATSPAELGFNARDLLEQSSQLIEAYIELADLKQSDYDANVKYPLTNLLKRISWNDQTSKIVIPTSTDSSGDPPRVASFDGWTYPGGITRPKKVTCKATNNQSYHQMVKGGEDPRADSVTAQLFSVINVLLKGNDQCRRRDLEVRTYKVIPLHPQAGLIEWVADAVGIGSVLGATLKPDEYRRSLHGRYDSNGWTHKTCTEHMKKVQDTYAKKSFIQLQAESRQALEQIFANTQPVMRYHFFDRSSTAPRWFQLRLAYTRSVAASSMAGFVVGLGDRHTNNILLLEKSGEVVHIDLGIVFEHGRLLPMPEMVPFRLSRDIVDGMGPAGTEGVFSRCCEETLHVLRENRQALLAVVDVLLHDPLTSWKLSASKRASAQRRGDNADEAMADSSRSGTGRLDEESGGMSLDATFVRNRVKEKLEGWDRGELLSVEGQVKKLVVDATSIDHLSLLYRGWSAWM